MAINLRLKQNVLTPNSEYPYGAIQDDTGANNGTPVNTEVYGDFHQFFAKMFAASGLTYNNLPDNAYDGFQYYDALVAVITLGINVHSLAQTNATWTSITLVNNWQNAGTGHDAEYWKDPWGWVHVRGWVRRSNSSTGDNVGMFIFPSGYRPAKTVGMMTYAVSPIGYAGADPVYIEVNSAGSFVPHETKAGANILNTFDQSGDYLVLDGFKFKT